MSIVLWVLQVVIALYCFMGAFWRFKNYEQAAKDVPSMAALPRGAWNALGLFEVVCALGLLVPGFIGIAAACLAVEMLLVSALHVKFFGFKLTATNPAVWTFGLCVCSVLVAYGRLVLAPI